MKIAVTGATGTQGGAVVRLLTERGHEVRRITRNPAHPDDVHGNFDDPASLATAFADVVFTSVTNADRKTSIPHFDTKAEIERYLAAHHPHWTVLGPAAFMSSDGPVVLPIPPTLKLHVAALHAEFPEIGWHSYTDWVRTSRKSTARKATTG